MNHSEIGGLQRTTGALLKGNEGIVVTQQELIELFGREKIIETIPHLLDDKNLEKAV